MPSKIHPGHFTISPRDKINIQQASIQAQNQSNLIHFFVNNLLPNFFIYFFLVYKICIYFVASVISTSCGSTNVWLRKTASYQQWRLTKLCLISANVANCSSWIYRTFSVVFKSAEAKLASC